MGPGFAGGLRAIPRMAPRAVSDRAGCRPRCTHGKVINMVVTTSEPRRADVPTAATMPLQSHSLEPEQGAPCASTKPVTQPPPPAPSTLSRPSTTEAADPVILAASVPEAFEIERREAGKCLPNPGQSKLFRCRASRFQEPCRPLKKIRIGKGQGLVLLFRQFTLRYWSTNGSS